VGRRVFMVLQAFHVEVCSGYDLGPFARINLLPCRRRRISRVRLPPLSPFDHLPRDQLTATSASTPVNPAPSPQLTGFPDEAARLQLFEGLVADIRNIHVFNAQTEANLGRRWDDDLPAIRAEFQSATSRPQLSVALVHLANALHNPHVYFDVPDPSERFANGVEFDVEWLGDHAQFTWPRSCLRHAAAGSVRATLSNRSTGIPASELFRGCLGPRMPTNGAASHVVLPAFLDGAPPRRHTSTPEIVCSFVCARAAASCARPSSNGKPPPTRRSKRASRCTSTTKRKLAQAYRSATTVPIALCLVGTICACMHPMTPSTVRIRSCVTSHSTTFQGTSPRRTVWCAPIMTWSPERSPSSVGSKDCWWIFETTAGEPIPIG